MPGIGHATHCSKEARGRAVIFPSRLSLRPLAGFEREIHRYRARGTYEHGQTAACDAATQEEDRTCVPQKFGAGGKCAPPISPSKGHALTGAWGPFGEARGFNLMWVHQISHPTAAGKTHSH